MTDKLNGWGHTRPVQTFPLPPSVRLEPQAISEKQIEVGALQMTSAQQLREGPQNFTWAGWEWLRSGWRSTEEEEARCWCCQIPSAPPVQVGQRYPKYLLGSNSRFIHSDVIQRKLSRKWHLSEQVEDLNLIHLFVSVLKQKLISMLLTQMRLYCCYGLIETSGEIWRLFSPQKTTSTAPLVFKKNTTDLIC